jgi:hypothetical protein
MIARHWHHIEIIGQLHALRVLIPVLTGKKICGPPIRYELGLKD